MLSPARPRHEPSTAASPTATRQHRRRWLDPRLWFGVVLVLASVLVGSQVLASVDDTVAVWQLAHDVPAGANVGDADLTVTQVHFDQSAAAHQYLLATEPIAPGLHAARDLHAGEMLTPWALSTAASPLTRQLPLGVGAAHQPADLRAGDHVDVWAVPGSSGSADAKPPPPMLALRNVVVLSVSGGLSGLSGERQVLVGIGAGVDVSTVLRQTVGAQVVLVRLAG